MEMIGARSMRSLIEGKNGGSSREREWTTQESRGRGRKFGGSQEATMTEERESGGRVLSGRERNGGGRGRVVYFKFFQTLGRIRRERKKASVAKGRWGVGSWSVMRGSGKEEKKGKKGKKGQPPGERAEVSWWK